MGEIVFVPKASLPGYSDGDSSLFSISLSLVCDSGDIEPRLSISGPNGNYNWEIFNSLDVSLCSGITAHNGSPYYVICDAILNNDGLYWLSVENDSNNRVEIITFDTGTVCESLSATTATYSCYEGLTLLPSGGVASGTLLIEKGVDSESVAYPFVSEVFLEDGTYTLTFEGFELDPLEVSCAIAGVTISTGCDASNAPNVFVVVDNIVYNEDYTLEIYSNDEIPVLLHTEVFSIPSFGSGNDTGNGGVEVHEFNTVPPIADSTIYDFNLVHTGLNAKSYLGTFNATHADVPATSDTLDCGTIGDNNDVKITNIRCDGTDGIAIDVELLSEDNYISTVYSIFNSTNETIYTEFENYAGTSTTRTLTIPKEAYPALVGGEWYLKILSIESETGITKTWYNNIYVYIPELVETIGGLENCDNPVLS